MKTEMKNDKTHIDELFKSSLGEYSEVPPPASWDAMEKKLQNKPAAYLPKHWFGYFAAITAILFLSITINRKTNDGLQAAPLAASSANITEVANVGTTTHGTANEKTTNATTATSNTVALAANTTSSGDSHGLKEINNSGPIATKTQKTERRFAPNTNNFGNKAASSSLLPASKKYNQDELAISNRTHGPNAEGNELPNGNTGIATTLSPQSGNTITGGNNLQDKNAIKKETKKEEPALLSAKETAKTENKKQATYQRVVAGIKGGYEMGFNNTAAKKQVISPFLEYRITERVSVMTQPSAKFSTVSKRNIGNARPYYQVNNDGKITRHGDSTRVLVLPDGETLWLRQYTYTQSHDSIVKSSQIGGSYLEVDAPLLLKYRLGKSFSVYGGVNVAWSKRVGITEKTFVGKAIEVTKEQPTIGGTVAPAPVPMESVITYSGNSISSYTGPQYPVPAGSLLRLGYMVGVSVDCGNRWLVDALVQQGITKPDVQGGYNTNAPLSAPYVRLMLGYKLIK